MTGGEPTRFSLGEGLQASPPLSLYVHLPWCIRKCPYCDFNSHQRPDDDAGFAGFIETYLAALERDCDLSAPLVWGRVVESVFIGGGTPSLFPAPAIDRLLALLRSRFQLRPQCEITLEANPGTFEAERYRGFAAAGVTRLSIGVQSFSDAALKALGRVHSSEQALQAIALAAECFDSFNIDLMYGLPGQDQEALARDLGTALSVQPPHLSYYQLTMEPNTYFAKFPPALPDEDRIDAMHEAIVARCGAAGLAQYEVSAYARQGRQCIHNRNYWSFGDYLGLGAGAHGKLSFHDRIVRQQKLRKPEDYIKAMAASAGAAAAGPHPAVEIERVLHPDDLVFEFFLNALRLKQGVPTALFGERTGLALSRLARPLDQALARGLLVDDPRVFAPSEQGFRFLNDLQMLFLAD